MKNVMSTLVVLGVFSLVGPVAQAQWTTIPGSTGLFDKAARPVLVNVVENANITIDVYMTNMRAHTFVSTINVSTGAVQSFSEIGDPSTSPLSPFEPAAVAWTGHHEVFINDQSGGFWHNIKNQSGVWGGWQRLFPNVSLCGPPSAVSWGPGRVDVFVLQCDGNLFHAAGINNSWNTGVFGGNIFKGNPVAVSPSGARLDVWFIDARTFTLADVQYNGSGWSTRQTGVLTFPSFGLSAAANHPFNSTISTVGVANIGSGLGAAVGDVFTDHPFPTAPSLPIDIASGARPTVATEDSTFAQVYFRNAAGNIERSRLDFTATSATWSTPTNHLRDTGVVFSGDPVALSANDGSAGLQRIFVTAVQSNGTVMFALDDPK